MKNVFWIIVSQILFSAGSFVAAQTPLKPRDTTINGPQTFAIILGISKYKYIRPLAYADKDAELFRDYLKSPGGGSVKDDNLFCLLNEKALNSNFWGKGFQWLRAKNLQKGDRLFIYLAGHGDAIDEDQFFFLSYDCNPEGDKNNYLVGGAIQLFNLKKKIAAETGKGVEVIFIMDACRSNELPGGLQGQNFLNMAISEKKAGEIIMLATGAGQESLEDASIGTGHGLFTYYLVDGLSGSADSIGAQDYKISYQEIKNYVDNHVPSAALQRFNQSQDPYFCCNENNETIISIVDTAYLRKWLKIKKQQNKGPGNFFPGLAGNRVHFTPIDTALIETYNRFNKAIAENNFTGNTSAEYYYELMNKKYSGSPYTLDARSTLAVEFINLAQNKVNQYLGCQDDITALQKQELYETGARLEKAIHLMREDDPDFANSLLGRMYLLKASGDFGKGGKNGNMSIAFQHAYGALAIDPNGAYIQNKLALLHLKNNRTDSALYYASKATRSAPKWVCAFSTLALVQNELTKNPATNPADTTKKTKNTTTRKIQFGGLAGGGISKLAVTTRPSGSNDTIRATGVEGNVKYDVGFITQISIGKRIDLRPSVLASIERSDVTYERRGAAGSFITEKIPVKTTSVSIPVPFIYRLPGKNVSPFISAGPTFSLLMQKTDVNSAKLAIRPFDISGDAGFGVDISFQKSHSIISPELKYSRSLTDINDKQNTGYSNVISKLNRQTFTFSIYLRGN